MHPNIQLQHALELIIWQNVVRLASDVVRSTEEEQVSLLTGHPKLSAGIAVACQAAERVLEVVQAHALALRVELASCGYSGLPDDPLATQGA